MVFAVMRDTLSKPRKAVVMIAFIDKMMKFKNRKEKN
jgi:hypothetical protein